jgi:C-terminal processing protease CtpA/Prc
MRFRSTMNALLLLLFFTGCTTAWAANDARPQPWQQRLPVIAPDALLRDVDVLETTYAALHPGLHRYLTDAELDDAYADLRRRFASPQRLDQAYLTYSAFAAKIHCGHTYANFYNQGKTVEQALLQHPRLPLLFRWIDGEMVVTRDLGSGAALTAGTRLLALDGVPADEILARLLPYARADGHNDFKQTADMQRIGSGRYEAFDVFYPLLYPRAVAPSLRVRYQRPGDTRTHSAKLRMMAFADVDAARDRKEDPASPLGWTLERPRNGIALLRMPSWVAYQHPDWDWRSYVDGLFRDLSSDGTTDLVIDLRGNEGGTSVGEVLIAYLVESPTPMSIATRSVRYRRIPDALRANLSTWDDSFYDWGEAAIGPSDGFYRLTKYDDAEAGVVIAPKTPRFVGRVWVLIGPDNSSATFEFAETVQQLRLGTLVGEPTGGNQRGINGGAFLFMTLPGSGIELDVPLIAQFAEKPMPDAGLLPDVSAPESAETIALGRDVALDAVLARIDIESSSREH